jgi:SRSO17 transposase
MYVNEQPIEGELETLGKIEIFLINGTEQETMWDILMRQYHYLGYTKMYGPRIKYIAYADQWPIALLSFNRAALTVGVRDWYIGWDQQTKHQYLNRVICNNRFLILPWVRVRNLASHLLSRAMHLIAKDWEYLYGISPFLVETFVDKPRYQGTCYKAANWLEVGETVGFGKHGRTFEYHGNRKAVFLFILDKRFHKELRVASVSKPRRIRRAEKARADAMMIEVPRFDPKIVNTCGLEAEDLQEISPMLTSYLNLFKPCYRRLEQKQMVDTFITGLLSDFERKSIEPIALHFKGKKGVRPMQMFFQNSRMNDEKMHQIYLQKAAETIGEDDGILNVDGSDFPKKGTDSVGVARQHCGIQGKTDNCQAGVFVGYTSSKGYGLLDRALYMPEKWFNPEFGAARIRCEVPAEVIFKTKNQLAIEMLNKIRETGRFPAKYVGCDSAFGCDRKFLESLPADLLYFADVKCNQLVFPEMPEMEIPEAKWTGRPHKHLRPIIEPVKVQSYADDERLPWARIILGEGAKGPVIADVKVVRCVSCFSSTEYGNYLVPGEEVWLYIRKYENGRIKYSLCNAPVDTSIETLNRLALMRWPIEQCFEECKSNLGMGHYETRSWQSWYRHMLFVMMAHLFTMILRIYFKKNSSYFDYAHD